MARFLTLGALALLTVAEVAAVVALVQWLGAAPTLLLLTLDVMLGLAVIRWAARGPAPDRGWRLTAGAFIALPGLVLDLVGVALLVPAIRSWLAARVTRGAESALRRRGVSVVTVTDQTGAARTTVVPGDVISGEVVQTDPGTPPGPAEPAAADDTPRVIRGEVTGPDS
jgi:UPF0716 family protein affecting phage T7 exclusion